MNPLQKQLDKIPETMLITLWAKAEETKQKKPLLRDETALGILSQINYDFSKFKFLRKFLFTPFPFQISRA